MTSPPSRAPAYAVAYLGWARRQIRPRARNSVNVSVSDQGKDLWRWIPVPKRDRRTHRSVRPVAPMERPSTVAGVRRPGRARRSGGGYTSAPRRAARGREPSGHPSLRPGRSQAGSAGRWRGRWRCAAETTSGRAVLSGSREWRWERPGCRSPLICPFRLFFEGHFPFQRVA